MIGMRSQLVIKHSQWNILFRMNQIRIFPMLKRLLSHLLCKLFFYSLLLSFLLGSVKKENKIKCELCTMWFDRKSVVYEVPNHRILELRKSWNYIQSGRRYASASYLYGNSLVCSFCSQFLSTTRGTDANHHEVGPQSSEEFYHILLSAHFPL
jgi:hypothetical protein